MINNELFEGPVGDYCIARNTIKCLFFTASKLQDTKQSNLQKKVKKMNQIYLNILALYLYVLFLDQKKLYK